MIFSSIKPAPHLSGFVKDYLIAHFVFGKDEPIPLKPYVPKPEQGLTFFLRGTAIMSGAQSSFRAPAVSVFGQQISRCNIQVSPEFLMFRIHFQPGVLYRLLKVPLSDFDSGYIDAEGMMQRDIKEVHERMNESRTYDGVVKIAEQFLEKKLAALKGSAHPIDQVAQVMERSVSTSTLDWLAGQACLCPRQFNRQFQMRMGVGPKLYSRLVRFHNACLHKEKRPSVDWFTIAIHEGYADYQHLVKDFKQFTNQTPNFWLQENARSPESFLRLRS